MVMMPARLNAPKATSDMPARAPVWEPALRFPVVERPLFKRMMGFESPPYQVEMIKSDGTVMAVEVNAVAVRKGKNIIGDLAILRDVTQQKIEEYELRESEEKYRDLLKTQTTSSSRLRRTGASDTSTMPGKTRLDTAQMRLAI